MEIYDPDILKSRASGRKKEFSEISAKIVRMKSRDADRLIHQLHEREFTLIKCLECANCCRNLGPRLTGPDIERMAGYLKKGTSEFFKKYVSVDEDRDYVFRSMPCPFLMEDNYCSIYNVRPRACRTYPHTDQKNIIGIAHICLKNTEVCPAVYNIFDKLSRNRLI